MSDKKTIVLTGASSGFGFGAAKALAEAGHHVFATMRGTRAKNEKPASELRAFGKAHGDRLTVVELDVADDTSVTTATREILGAGRPIDVLINNAGVGTWGPEEAFTVDQVKAMFDVNVFGVLRMNRALLPHMRQRGQGYVIYVSSGLGRIVFPFLGPYTASKFAIEALAETSSIELAQAGISTTILQPGAYGTSFLSNSIMPADATVLAAQPKLKAMFDAFGGAFEERAKSGMMGDPTEIVRAIVELVGLSAGARPLRKTVGADVAHPVTAINEACAGIQAELMKHFKLA